MAELVVPRVAELFVRHMTKAEFFTLHGRVAGLIQMLDVFQHKQTATSPEFLHPRCGNYQLLDNHQLLKWVHPTNC